MSDKKETRDKGITATEKAVIAIAAAVAVIVILVVAILYIYRHSATADTTKLPDAGAGTIETQGEAIDDETMQQIIEVATVRPGEWYGAYESSGKPDEKPELKDAEKQCSDVYAWIEIPATGIDLPIAYCENAKEPFYYTHDINGNPSDKGMIITDSLNSRDFCDPLTLVYGTNPGDDTMFAPLHRFHDKDFFDSVDTVNIYLDDAELIYKVYACYVGSADHILGSYDFYNADDFAKYFDSVKEVRDLAINVREEEHPQAGDHVITLVTHCDDESKRLFVHAVLEEVRY